MPLLKLVSVLMLLTGSQSISVQGLVVQSRRAVPRPPVGRPMRLLNQALRPIFQSVERNNPQVRRDDDADDGDDDDGDDEGDDDDGDDDDADDYDVGDDGDDIGDDGDDDDG